MPELFRVGTEMRVEFFVGSRDNYQRGSQIAKQSMGSRGNHRWRQVLNHFNHSNDLKPLSLEFCVFLCQISFINSHSQVIVSVELDRTLHKFGGGILNIGTMYINRLVQSLVLAVHSCYQLQLRRAAEQSEEVASVAAQIEHSFGVGVFEGFVDGGVAEFVEGEVVDSAQDGVVLFVLG